MYIIKSRRSILSDTRQYRNLIHPGRAIRTTESVSEHSAKIKLSLVELIVDEVAEQKRQSYKALPQSK